VSTAGSSKSSQPTYLATSWHPSSTSPIPRWLRASDSRPRNPPSSFGIDLDLYALDPAEYSELRSPESDRLDPATAWYKANPCGASKPDWPGIRNDIEEGESWKRQNSCLSRRRIPSVWRTLTGHGGSRGFAARQAGLYVPLIMGANGVEVPELTRTTPVAIKKLLNLNEPLETTETDDPHSTGFSLPAPITKDGIPIWKLLIFDVSTTPRHIK
jgi:hypothetical protein